MPLVKGSTCPISGIHERERAIHKLSDMLADETMTRLLLFTLPVELVREIAQYLPSPSLSALARTCHRAYELLNPVLYSLPLNRLLGVIEWARARGMREQQTMHRLLDHNLSSILQVDYVKYIALWYACLAGFNEIVTRLLESGVHPNPTRNDYPLFFPYVARDNRKEIVMMLLSAGVDLGRYDFYKVFGMVCYWNPENHDVPRALVRHGLDIHMVYSNGDNLLHGAVSGNLPISDIALLLDVGVDINHRNVKGRTPLTAAIAIDSDAIYDTEKRDIVELLLERGAKTDLPDNESWHPLHHAADYAKRWAVRLLSQHGADPDARTADGETPLHLACRSYQQSATVIKALLDAGAHPAAEATTNAGEKQTPMHIALETRHYVGLRCLYDRWMAMFPALPSADVILIAAAALGEVALLQRLIDRKTVNIEGDGRRTTALMAAAAAGQDEAIKLLLRHVRNVDMPDGEGKTALQLAVRFATESTIQLLLPRSSKAWVYLKSSEMLIANAGVYQSPGVVRSLLESRRHQNPQQKIDWKEVFHYLDGGPIVDTARIIFEYMKPADVQPRGDFLPLMFFIDNGCNDIALKIIAQGIRLNSRDERGFTPLMLAARKGELALVRALVRAGADLEARSGTDSHSALSLAVFHNHGEVVQCLLAAGANIDVPASDLDGESFLIHAVWHKHLDIVRSLLEADVNLNICGGADDYTPLSWAVLGGSFDAVNLLLAHGAKVQLDGSGKDPLNLAVISGFELIAALLVEAGAPIDELDRHGRTILARAASRGMGALVRVLLDEGVRVDAPDRHGRTPFLTASCRGHYEIARLLLEKGADIHQKDYFGRSALSLAADQGHVEVVRWLIERGANINEGDRTSRTPLSWAMQMGSHEAVEALVLAGCDVLKTDHYGRTPLQWASSDACIAKLYSLSSRM